MARAITVTMALSLLLGAAWAAPLPAPLALQEGGGHFFAGEQVLRTVSIGPVLAAGGPARLSWLLSADGASVLSGSASDGQVLLALPRVKRITALELHLSLERNGAVLASGRRALQVYPPRPAPPAGVAHKRVLLLDPTGRTAAALGYLGIAYTEAGRSWTAATGSADLIVVGDSVPADALARFLQSVRGMVASGAACLVLEQTGLDARQFPGLALAPPGGEWGTYANPAGPRVVRGDLPEGALTDWRPGGALRPFATPVHGDFTLLLDVDRAGRGAPATAVLEVPHGKGRYVFSQLPLAGSFGAEPAARYVLANLLAYTANLPPLPSPARAAVLADPHEAAFTKAFDRIGLEADLNPPSLEGYGVAVVYGSRAAARRFDRRRTALTLELRAFTAAGGKVVLLDQQPGTVDTFSGIYDGTAEVAAGGQQIDLGPIWGKPQVRGMRRGELEALLGRAEFPLITYRGRRDPAPVSAPGLLAVAQGKGAVLFCQLPLPQADDDAPALRTFSQLFTNLHLTLKGPNRRDAR